MRPASKRFPEKGFEDVAIADLMKEVGLTVGGFCKYFDSRECFGGRITYLCVVRRPKVRELAK